MLVTALCGSRNSARSEFPLNIQNRVTYGSMLPYATHPLIASIGLSDNAAALAYAISTVHSSCLLRGGGEVAGHACARPRSSLLCLKLP